ncbi:transposase [Kitasatospora sp. GP30]|nr:transposase [Kitasatospora sp. GP30]
MVRSVTHSRFGAGAVKSRRTRSGAGSAPGSWRVKPLPARRADSLQAGFAHQAFDPLAADVDTLALEGGVHARRAVDPAGLGVDLADAAGQLLEVTVTPANVHDSVAAPELIDAFMAEPGRLLKLVWADTAYQGPALAEAFAAHGVGAEVVKRPDGTRGFMVLARRWAVERTLG